MKIRTKFGLFSGGVVMVTVAILATVAFILQRRLIESNMADIRRVQSAGFAAVCRQAITPGTARSLRKASWFSSGNSSSASKRCK